LILHSVHQERIFAAIMFTDIVGYTALMGTNESRAMEILRQSRKLQQSCVSQHQGKWLKEMGDGVMAQFKQSHEAVFCALEIQENAKNLGCNLRIGIHSGEITVENNDIFGDSVNIASRLQSIADPGGIYISDIILQNIKERLGTDHHIQTQYIGPVHLKNVVQPITTHALKGKCLPVVSKKKSKELVGSGRVESLAVLPFKNLSKAKDQQFFVDGIQEALIGELSQIRGLRVISRTSTLVYRNSIKNVQEIASELKVDAFVEASVLRVDNKVRVQAQLIKAFPEEQHLWSGAYDSEIKDVFALYNEVVKGITHEVGSKLTDGEKEDPEQSYEVDPKAYEAYLKGVFHWEKLSPSDLESSLEYFEQVIHFDPNFAPAYSGIAGVWLGRIQMGLVCPQEAAPSIKAYIQKTISINANFADSYYWEAQLESWYEWNWEKGKSLFEKTLRLNPNHSLARAYYSHALYITGEIDESLQQMEDALDLDPFNVLMKAMYGMILNYARNYEKALDVLTASLSEHGAHPIILSTLRTIYHNQGKFDLAYEIFKRSYLEKGDKEAADILEKGFKKDGYSMALEKTAELMVKRSEGTYSTPWQIATLYTRADNKNKAIEYLENSYRIHDTNMPYISVDPIFDGLRDHPGFQTLIEKMKLINVHKLNKHSEQ